MPKQRIIIPRPFSTDIKNDTLPPTEITKNQIVVSPREGFPHDGTIIWIHGVGETQESLLELFQVYLSTQFPSFRFVVPIAPLRPVTVNKGSVMPAWFDIIRYHHTAPEDKNGINFSMKTIHRVLDKETAIIDSNRILIGGFGQGAGLAIYSGLQYSKPLAGIVSCSGYSLKEMNNKKVHDANTSTPLYSIHGLENTAVYSTWVNESLADLERRFNTPITYDFDPGMKQELTEYCMANICTFIKKRLESPYTVWTNIVEPTEQQKAWAAELERITEQGNEKPSQQPRIYENTQ